jgi:2-dehydropantoate 2-reductase
MHVAIIGLGALGRVYGTRLVALGGVAVTFVVRPARLAAPPAPIRITRIDNGATHELDAPALDVAVPPHADVVLVCVRVEQLDASFDELLTAVPEVPVVMLTPMLPPDLARLTQTHGSRLRAAMPGVVAYENPGGECRYWLPKVAPTLIDAAPPVPPVVNELASALAVAGFGGRLELGVHEANPATTLALVPLAMGVDAAGSVDLLLADRALLRIALDAVGEGLVLAAKIGQVPSWLDLLTRFAGPTALKLGMGLARTRAPEAIVYVDAHFGRKLHAQNVVMARAIVALAHEKGTPSKALEALLAQLEAIPAAGA